jgi:hypothetical protein
MWLPLFCAWSLTQASRQGAILTLRLRMFSNRGVIMGEASRFTIICPCCESQLIVDAQTGSLISHEEKTKPVASFDEMVKGLDKQKQVREQIFAQELNSMKDRDRILEEKFQEAMKRADKDKGKPYRNPLDLD